MDTATSTTPACVAFVSKRDKFTNERATDGIGKTICQKNRDPKVAKNEFSEASYLWGRSALSGERPELDRVGEPGTRRCRYDNRNAQNRKLRFSGRRHDPETLYLRRCGSFTVPFLGSDPPGAKSLALIVDDPDAPAKTWVHWVVFDLPADSGGLPESVPADPTLSTGARQGINDFQRIGYGGPCPPGGTHRYFFKLYALDTRLELDPGSSKSQLLSAMEGHILAEGQLMGRYAR